MGKHHHNHSYPPFRPSPFPFSRWPLWPGPPGPTPEVRCRIQVGQAAALMLSLGQQGKPGHLQGPQGPWKAL